MDVSAPCTWELAGDRDFHIKAELDRVAFSTLFFFVCLFLFPDKEKWNCACWNKPVGASGGQTRRIIP